MEKEERYRTTDYKYHQKKETTDSNSRDTHAKIKKREEEEERDNHRSHRERDQYIEQYYKMLDRPRKLFNAVFTNLLVKFYTRLYLFLIIVLLLKFNTNS